MPARYFERNGRVLGVEEIAAALMKEPKHLRGVRISSPASIFCNVYKKLINAVEIRRKKAMSLLITYLKQKGG